MVYIDNATLGYSVNDIGRTSYLTSGHSEFGVTRGSYKHTQVA